MSYTESEAWQTIEQAKQLALRHFTSWQDFGKSQAIGMALDYYRHDDAFFNDFLETYHQVTSDSDSPWQRIGWGNF